MVGIGGMPMYICMYCNAYVANLAFERSGDAANRITFDFAIASRADKHSSIAKTREMWER